MKNIFSKKWSNNHYYFAIFSKMSSTLSLTALIAVSSQFAKMIIPIFLSGINVRMLL